MAKQRKSKPAKRLTKHVVVDADIAFWAGLLGQMSDKNFAEVIRIILEPELKKKLQESGMDPDKLWFAYLENLD